MITVLRVLLIIVEVISSVLLIGIILLQKSKDEGLGLAFGSGVGETLFGSRAGNVLTRITVTLAAIFLVTTILLGVLYSGASTREQSLLDRVPEKAEQTAPLTPAAPMVPAEEPSAQGMPAAATTAVQP